MTIVWLALTVFLALIAANLYQHTCDQSARIDALQRALILAHDERNHPQRRLCRWQARVAAPSIAIPTFDGPTGPITLN